MPLNMAGLGELQALLRARGWVAGADLCSNATWEGRWRMGPLEGRWHCEVR